MRKRALCAALAGAAMLSMLSGPASAQSQAYTSTPVNLYAGPAQDYPLVAQLPAGYPVTVYGCVSGYSWCDVATPQARGWVYAGSLSYPYQGSNVPLMTYGTAIGLPIVTFSLGAYWGSYYRGRPWYGDQGRWAHHPPPPYRPPPPPPHHGGHRPPPPPPHNGGDRPPPPPPAHGGSPSPQPGYGSRPPGQDHGHRPGPPQGGGSPPGPPPGHGGPSSGQGGSGNNQPRPSGPPSGQGQGGHGNGPQH